MKELTRKEEQILLAVNILRNDAYLISIRQKINEFTGSDYSIGTVYAPLNRLHISGYLETSLRRTRESNKPVRYYTLTDKGYQSLMNIKKLTEKMWDKFVFSHLEHENE